MNVATANAAERLVGDSASLREVNERIRLAAESNATILILGETGTGKSIVDLSPDVRRILLDFCWPGNVRQLENAIEHAFVTCPGTEIGLFDLPVEIRLTHLREQLCRKSAPTELVTPQFTRRDSRVESPPREQLERLLVECRQNRAEVARRLGVDRTTIWRWMKRYGLVGNQDGSSSGQRG